MNDEGKLGDWSEDWGLGTGAWGGLWCSENGKPDCDALLPGCTFLSQTHAVGPLGALLRKTEENQATMMDGRKVRG